MKAQHSKKSNVFRRNWLVDPQMGPKPTKELGKRWKSVKGDVNDAKNCSRIGPG